MRYAYTPEQYAGAEWVGHRVVEFASDQCAQCGNEQLKHLHKIKLPDSTVIEVGCVCASTMCPAQQPKIATAEKEMTKELERLKHQREREAARVRWKLEHAEEERKVWEAFLKSWQKTTKLSYRAVYRGTPVRVFWDMGIGYTCSLPGSPTKFKSLQEGKEWAIARIKEKHDRL